MVLLLYVPPLDCGVIHLFFFGGANGNPPNWSVLWKLIHMTLGDEVVKLLVLRCVLFHGLKDELGPTGEAYHPHPKNTHPSKPPSLGQDALYGTLEKSQGSCLVRHNELPSLKAEAKIGGKGGWGMGWDEMEWMKLAAIYSNEILVCTFCWFFSKHHHCAWSFGPKTSLISFGGKDGNRSTASPWWRWSPRLMDVH